MLLRFVSRLVLLPEITAQMLRIAPAPAHAVSVIAATSARTLEDVEREMLREALHRTMWNVSRAAQMLGVSRDTLRYRMVKFGMRRPSFDGDGVTDGVDGGQNA